MAKLTSGELTKQIQAAIKSGDKRLVSVLRLLSTAIKNAEVSKMDELSDEETIQVIAREARKREEAAEEFTKGNREDRAAAEIAEAEILRQWLPEQLSADELEKLVAEAVDEAGATEASQMGQVMKVLMPKIMGRADGKVVSDEVRKKLS